MTRLSPGWAGAEWQGDAGRIVAFPAEPVGGHDVQLQGDCRQAGYPIRALTNEDARMLGVTTIELALDAGRRHVRITERRLDRDSAEPQA